MRRIGVGVLLVAAVFAHACASQPPVQPTVTAKGTVGEEDVPDVSVRQVALKAGETLIVSCNDEGGDAEVYFKDTRLHKDVTMVGNGFYTSIFSLYSTTDATGDVVGSHASAGDITINAYVVTGLAPSALDKTASAKGMDTSPSSGATPATTHANELLWGTIGYATNGKPTGTWNNGFTGSPQFTNTGGISGVEDGYKTVSATGTYAAGKTGIDKDAWAAVIATYATKNP